MKTGISDQWSELSVQRSAFSVQRSMFDVRCSIRSFTLIELLAVIAIIVLLAGIIIGTATYVNRKSLEAKTKSQMKQIELALEMYKRDMGYYPMTPSDTTRMSSMLHNNESSVTNNNLALYRALTNRDSTGLAYLEVKPDMVQLVAVAGLLTTNNYNALIDPYGNLWGYLNYPGSTNQFNPRTYDLWSFGLNYSIDATNSVIPNWRQQ